MSEVTAWCRITNRRCSEPYDCDTCELLWEALPDNYKYLWICPGCARDRTDLNNYLKENTALVGAYTSGTCQSPVCDHPRMPHILLQLVAAY